MPFDAADIAAFNDTDLPGYALATIGAAPVHGRFRAVYADALGMSGSKPMFSAATADLAGVTEDTAITINGDSYISLVGITAFVKSSIDAADSLNDLSQKLGISVRELAKYELAAKQSGTSLEAIAKGVKGLAGNMVEHSGALAKAGITAKDADGAMRQLADLFTVLPDGVEKTTLAVKLFGKSGMDMIPMLNMGSEGLKKAADASARYAEIMATLAPGADRFNDQLAELKLNSSATAAAFAANITPTLNNLLEQMIEGTRIAGGFGAALLQFGTMNPFKNVAENLKSTREELDKLKSGNLGWMMFGAADFEIKGRIESLQKDLEFLKVQQRQNLPQASYSNEGHGYRTDRTFEIDGINKAQKLLKALGGEAKNVKDEFSELLNQINAKNVGLDPSFWKDLNTLNKGYQAGRVTVEEYADAVGKLTMSQKFYQDQLKESAAVQELIRKAEEERVKGIDEATGAAAKDAAAIREHTAEIGLSKEAIASRKAALDEDVIAVKEQELAMLDAAGKCTPYTEALRENLKTLKDRQAALRDNAGAEAAAAVAKNSFEEWDRGWKETDRLGREVFTDWENASKTVGSTLKKALLSAVYEATAKPIMFQMYAGVTGALGMPGVAASNAGGSLAGSAAGSFLSSTMLGGASLTAIGGSIGTGFMATLSGQSIGAAASAYSAAGMSGISAGLTVGAAIPYVAAAVAALKVLGAFDSGGGPKVGGDAFASGGKISDWNNVGWAFNENQTNAAMATAMETFTKGINETVIKLGGKINDSLSYAFGTASDPSGDAPDRVASQLLKNGTQVYGASHEVGRGAASTELTAQMDRLMVAALKESSLPAWANEILSALDPATTTVEQFTAAMTQLDATLTQINGAETARQSLLQSLMTPDEQVTAARQALTSAGLGETAQSWKDKLSSLDPSKLVDQNTIATMTALKGAFDLVQTSATDATGGIDDAARSLADVAAVTRGLSQDRDTLAVHLLRAQGKETEANTLARTQAIAGLNAEQVALWDANEATRVLITSLNSQAAAAVNVASVTQGLNREKDTLAVDLLRAQGKETEANTLARTQAIAGLNAEQVALWDANEATRVLITSLNSQAAAAVNVASVTQGLNREKDTLAVDLLRAQGKETEANTLARTQAIAGLNAEQVALWDANEATRTLIGSMTTQAQVAKDAAQAYVDAQAKVKSAEGDLRTAYQREAGDLQAIIDKQTADHAKAIEDASENLKRAYQNESSAMQSTIDKLHATANAYRTFRDSLVTGNLSPLSPEEKYRALAQQFEDVSARKNAGDQSAIDSFQGVAQNFLAASQAYNASSSQYQTDYQRVLAETRKGVAATESQAVVAQQQLTALTAQVSALVQLDNSTLSVKAAIDALKIAQTATINQTAQLQLTALNSQVSALIDINTSVLSVKNAISALVTAQSAAAIAGATAAIAKASASSSSAVSGTAVPVTSANNNKGLTILPTDSAAMAAAKVLYQSATGGVDSALYNKYVGSASVPGWNGDPAELRKIYGFADGTNYLLSDGPLYGHIGEEIKPAAYVDKERTERAETNALLRKVIEELRADKTQRGAVGTATIDKLEKVVDRLDGTKRAINRNTPVPVHA